MNPPVVTLENITEAEKDILAVKAKKEMNTKIYIFVPCFLVSGYAVFYVNGHYMGLGLENENLRSFINVSLVILTLLPMRLLVGAVIRYRKTLAFWQKKVFRGVIDFIDGNVVQISNQRIKIPAEEIKKLKPGEEVMICTTVSGDLFISISKKS
ncbi:MAG: hypothetical protein HY064_15155 [Bacteroidetes bacterium]|nr:hypothetical protein [Bacteroidota bacterium]